VVFLSRLIAALAYAGAAFLFGVALGERGELGVVQRIFTFVVPLTTLVLTIFTRQGRVNVLFTGLMMLAGLFLGQAQFSRAWNECTTAGLTVRDALLRHHQQHDGYPARLEDLDLDLPCRAGLRPTILHYLSNDRGFRLWISNDRQVLSFAPAKGRGSPQSH